jgi:histidine triad (HIT) family protein
MTDESACVFCKLLAGEAGASFVYRDETCAAFMDIRPINAGHLLVVPVRHAPHLADLSEEECGRMFRVARRMAAALRESGLRCEGVNLFLADGAAAMQEVFHAHLHVFPRFAGDGFGLRFPPTYSDEPEREALDDAAEKIRGALRAR